MREYDHQKIEKKWQESWSKAALYQTPDTVEGRDNFYLLVEFPYPSGNLHVGHWYAFAVPDILARYLRMTGKNVLYPIGFDAFGLPAENAAIKNKINPREWTANNIAYMQKQIASMGTSFDTSREVQTFDPTYYKWTQWLFLQLFKAQLAYRKETAVNWCPKDKTVLANEQVVGGRCERCDSEVEQRQMLQWNLKITDYADRLADDLASLDWPEEIKQSQRNWIGRSEGAEIDFALDLGKKNKYVILHGFQGSPESARWQWIKEQLEKRGHEVVVPQLPNTNEPTEEEQVAAALSATTYDENTVLCGHSLGAVVALKVLEKLQNPIARFVSIGGFIDCNFKDKPRNFEKTFNWNFDKKKILGSARSITLLHDPQDHAVSSEQALRLSELLQTPLTLGVSNKTHFTGDTEPDVLLWLQPTIRVFTTRADTLFGATYLVLSPEHPWITLALRHRGLLKNKSEISEYITRAHKKTELERLSDQKEKTGVKIDGVEAFNPATGEKIPVFVADYVLGHYGTGAIMAVPAHDDRDFQFAQKFNVPIKQVVAPVVTSTKGGDAVHEGEPFTDRVPVMCVVKHWEKDEFLCIQSKLFPDIQSFISGGIEEGEDLIEAARREILEESGYKNARFIRQIGGFSYVEFYHRIKKTNIRAQFRYVYFELEDGGREKLSKAEDDLHHVVWKKRNEVLDFLSINEKERVWNQFLNPKDEPYVGKGRLVNSGQFDRLTTEEAREKLVQAFGRKKTTYKLRDWIVSRQRYWGVPIPVIHCDSCGSVPVPDGQLPVLLPEIDDYLPTGDGKSPLAKVRAWVEVACPNCGKQAERETDTFDTFVDSSWYFLRYTDPTNAKEFASALKQKNWMPIDLYSGGAEHTTMHLLYSRFWQKALFDIGLVADPEPYTRRMNRSIILGPDNQKMSKSRGNVIDPDEVVQRLGADTVRMYLAFIGPYGEVGNYPWDPNGVVGVRRFLERVWRIHDSVVTKNSLRVEALETVLHKAIKKVGDDIKILKFNTAISALMIAINAIEKAGSIEKQQWLLFLRLLSPFAPHMAEELWAQLGEKGSIHTSQWPKYDPKLLVEDNVTIAIQINGKARDQVVVPSDASQEDVEATARNAIVERLEDKRVVRVIFVPGRLINLVLEA